MDSRVSALWTRFRANRLASILFILATLAVGILIGTVVSSGVRGQESKKNTTSDATALTIPSPQQTSSQFSQIANKIEPSVVNINTESIIKAPRRRRGQAQPSDPDASPFDDFFDKFFGGQGGGEIAVETSTNARLGLE